MKRKKKAVKKKPAARKALTSEQRVKLLKHFCDPLPDDFKSPFTCVGILPHGQPLFADGTTTCMLCNGLKVHTDLRLGLCASCVKHLCGIAKSLRFIRQTAAYLEDEHG